MRYASSQETRTVAIVGGGVSGALTALHLRRSVADAPIVILEPRPELGLGLAYSTPSLRHLLNVPAGKISALPEDPEHFLRWLREHFDATATAATFAPRAIFGRYIQSLFQEARDIEHRQTSVVDMQLLESGVALTLEDGDVLAANYAVLATGNFDPAALEGVDDAAVERGLYCHNAWSEATYAGLPPEAPVLLVGTGLTGVDVVLRLRELGHRGVITAVSRHGVFPNRHAAYTPAAKSAIPEGTPPSCLHYLRALRASLARGVAWRAAIDSLRATTNDLWLALPVEEQARFRRHLQRRWDVVRHRMAPSTADSIEAELAQGTLRLAEGHVAGVSAGAEGARLLLRSDGEVRELIGARVINCTGPSMKYHRVRSPLLRKLLAEGTATPGPLGGGLNCTRKGALINRQGRALERIFNLGPGRLGTLLESIAIPEIRQQAVEVARTLAERLHSNGQQEALRVAQKAEAGPETLAAA